VKIKQQVPAFTVIKASQGHQYIDFNKSEEEGFLSRTEHTVDDSTVCDVVMIHGFPRYGFPDTSSKNMQYMKKEEIAEALSKMGLGANPIKLVCCFGGVSFLGGGYFSWIGGRKFSTAQTIANKLNTNVYAADWKVAVDDKGVWKKFTPK